MSTFVIRNSNGMYWRETPCTSPFWTSLKELACRFENEHNAAAAMNILSNRHPHAGMVAVELPEVFQPAVPVRKPVKAYVLKTPEGKYIKRYVCPATEDGAFVISDNLTLTTRYETLEEAYEAMVECFNNLDVLCKPVRLV